MAVMHTAGPIEVGATYRTRAGHTVTIRNFDESENKYFGDILDSAGCHVRIASFSESGRYVQGRDTEFDIVSRSGAA